MWQRQRLQHQYLFPLRDATARQGEDDRVIVFYPLARVVYCGI